MKRIWLPKYRRYVTVDNCDEAYCRSFALTISGGSRRGEYVYAYRKGMGDPVPLHRLIAVLAGIDITNDIDHRNRRKLDCRRRNLRPATRTQNFANRPKYRNNTSGFKGVIWNKQARRWQARVTKGRRQFHMGYFSTPEAAYRAYRAGARNHFGAFASP